MTTPTPTTAAPDPVREALDTMRLSHEAYMSVVDALDRIWLEAHNSSEPVPQFVSDAIKRGREVIERHNAPGRIRFEKAFDLLEARAMQEAKTQGGEVKPGDIRWTDMPAYGEIERLDRHALPATEQDGRPGYGNAPEPNAGNIVTEHVYPPIPHYGSDWCAYYDDIGPEGPKGWGRTEAEAIADLKDVSPRAVAMADAALRPSAKGGRADVG